MSIDWNILDWIQSSLCYGFLDWLMPLITALGNGGALWIFTGVVLLCFRRTRPAGVMLLVGLALGALIGNGLLKPLIARERPCWVDFRVDLLIPEPQDFSFPSGHTLSSAVAATILTLWRHSWGRVAIPLAALIAFSRLYLFVHFPSDVLAGALIGIGLGFLVYDCGDAILQRIRRRKEAMRHERSAHRFGG